jgi:hypothetical protein
VLQPAAAAGLGVPCAVHDDGRRLSADHGVHAGTRFGRYPAPRLLPVELKETPMTAPRRDSISIPVPAITPPKPASASDPRIANVLALRESFVRTMSMKDRAAYKQAHAVLSREEKRVFVEAVEAADKGRKGSGSTQELDAQLEALK